VGLGTPGLFSSLSQVLVVVPPPNNKVTPPPIGWPHRLFFPCKFNPPKDEQYSHPSVKNFFFFFLSIEFFSFNPPPLLYPSNSFQLFLLSGVPLVTQMATFAIYPASRSVRLPPPQSDTFPHKKHPFLFRPCGSLDPQDLHPSGYDDFSLSFCPFFAKRVRCTVCPSMPEK